MFNHIQSTLRPNVYAEPDYFRWEGGYSDYAREVAAEHLQDWIERRNMVGTDAVTHSHGGNVLLKATQLGCEFGDVLLLSCPVDERKYKLNKKAVLSVRSLRIRFDLVILADRIMDRIKSDRPCWGQKFSEESGIKEDYLPCWYDHHSDTTKPDSQHKVRI